MGNPLKYRMFLNEKFKEHQVTYGFSPITNGTDSQNLWANDVRTKLLLEFEKKKNVTHFDDKFFENFKKILNIDDFKWWIYYGKMPASKVYEFVILHHNDIKNAEVVDYSDVYCEPIQEIKAVNTSKVNAPPAVFIPSPFPEVVREPHQIPCNEYSILINEEDSEFLHLICTHSSKLQWVLSDLNDNFVEEKEGYSIKINSSNPDRGLLINSICTKLIDNQFSVSKKITNSSLALTDCIVLPGSNDNIRVLVKDVNLFKLLKLHGYQELIFTPQDFVKVKHMLNGFSVRMHDAVFNLIEEKHK